MNRGALICVLGGIATGFLSRRRTIIVAMAAMALLPIDASDAGRLAQTAKSPPRHGKSPKHRQFAKAPYRKACRPRPGRLAFQFETGRNNCDPAKFRIVLDVGHTANQKARSAPATSPSTSSICDLRSGSRKN